MSMSFTMYVTGVKKVEEQKKNPTFSINSNKIVRSAVIQKGH